MFFNRFGPFVLTAAIVSGASTAFADGCADLPIAGVTLSGQSGCFPPNENGGDVLITGFGGASGALEVTGGAQLSVIADPTGLKTRVGGAFVTGEDPGSVGVTTISGAGSTIIVEGGGGGGFATVGSKDGTGFMTIQDGGALIVRDPGAAPGSGATAGETLQIGRRGGVGALVLDAGSVTVESAAGATLFVGDRAGAGTMTVRNGSVVTVHDAELAGPGAVGANITVGREVGGTTGSTGSMTVTGSTVSVTSENDFAGFFVGREAGAAGSATITGGATFVIDGGNEASIAVGRDGGSVGTLVVSGGAQLALSSDRSIFDIGRREGATGAVTISGDADVSVSATDAINADVFVGASFADFGRATAGSGTLTVTGAGSTLTVGDSILLGALESAGGGSSSGAVIVTDGASVTASRVNVGAGGVLTGAGGTINADVILDGGVVAPGSSPGTLIVNGDFTVLSGLLEIEIAGTGPGEFDFLDISGDFIAESSLEIALKFLDGFVPDEGTEFSFIDIQGDSSDLDDLFAQNLVTVSVQGLGAGSVFDLAFAGGALSTVATTVVGAVPLPAPLAMMLFAVGALGFAGRRRVRPAAA